MAWTKEQAESLMLREHWQEIYARFERLVREKTCKHPRSIQAIVLPPPHYRRKLLHNVLLKESMQEAIRRGDIWTPPVENGWFTFLGYRIIFAGDPVSSWPKFSDQVVQLDAREMDKMFQGLGPPTKSFAEALGLSFGVVPYTQQWQQAENAYLQQTAQINLQQAMANQQASLQGDLLGQAVTIQEGLAGQRINAVDALKGPPLPDYRIYDELAKRMTQEQNRMKPEPRKRDVDLFPKVVCQKAVPGGLVQVIRFPSALHNGERYEINFQPDGPPKQKKPGWFSRWMDRPKPFLRPKFRVWPVIWVSAGLIGAGCVVLKSVFIIQENLTWTL